VVPYAALAGAAARLDPAIGLAATSRWDDEDRVWLGSTLPAALVGAVDGAGTSPREALGLDHLIDDDHMRLVFQLDIIERLGDNPAGKVQARLALSRAVMWLRRHVPARTQPALAQRLLDAAATHGLDGHVRAQLDPIIVLRPADRDPRDLSKTHRFGTELPAEIQALLDKPTVRSWRTLHEDVIRLTKAYVYGDQMRSFLTAVADATPPHERRQALEAIAALPAQSTTDAVLPVLADYVDRWRGWPGIADWATSTLPDLLDRHLRALAWDQNYEQLLAQLRSFDNDAAIRRAILAALPEARPHLTALGWQNIAVLLGRLCGTVDAAEALVGLLADGASEDTNRDRALVTPEPPRPGPVSLLLWSAFGHPRRAMRWRAAHAARELLTHPDPAVTAPLAADLVGCLDRIEAGAFRAPDLHFYRLSAAAGLLVALCRVANERPAVIAPHLEDLIRHATSRDLPHAQIRELARQAALAITDPSDPATTMLRHANRPASCIVNRQPYHFDDDRRISDERRYDFDSMDTIPYWYAPLARVFDVPVDVVAEHAERWILDEWGLGRDDWWTDQRELRDQSSSDRMSHSHGSIPPEENLRLYVEYHAMMATGGELADLGKPILVDSDGFNGNDPWQHWLDSYLPNEPGLWLAELRSPVPADPQLFGRLPPLDEWDVPTALDFERALDLIDGQLPDSVVVAGYTELRRRGAYSSTHIKSALVIPDYADDLRRALAAAKNPYDWKLPDEREEEFEVHEGKFGLTGWLSERAANYERLDEHDPYAYGLRASRDLPGDRFRSVTNTILDPTGQALLSRDGTVMAHIEQWADPFTKDNTVITSSGYRTTINRGTLLTYLDITDTSLIMEVQIGRNRSGSDRHEYQTPHSRIYLVDRNGRLTF
jgi:hypothetical protein